MPITLYNTFTRQKEPFTPFNEGSVSLYHCGPTVYDYVHIGNLRSYVFADTLRRMFEHEGFAVNQVINITDVGHLTSDDDEGEDKVEAASRKEKKTPKEITDFYTDAFLKDLERLNIKTADTKFPRASEYIPQQIALIQKLEEKGVTYVISDGVYFDTSKTENYGKLAGLDTAGLREGARVAVNPEKRNPTDFALWKFSPRTTTRKQEWDSPWGAGFPGWHIECSAMAMELLGETIDIHTSGVDHIPIHHTNEIAQSEGATGKQFVRYWLHHEHVLIDDTKMSKSLGNIILLQALIDKNINPLAYRYFLLTAHYKSLVNVTWEALEGAERALSKLYEHYQELVGSLSTETPSQEIVEKHREAFMKHIRNDLDTPHALALLWGVIKDEKLSNGDKKTLMDEYDKILGLGFTEISNDPLPAHIEALADERSAARAREDWEKADTLRQQIEEEGFTVKDTDEGQKITKRLL